jgi:hypothetical protein
MERPPNISKNAWKFLSEEISDAAGTILLAAGILDHPDLLNGLILSIPLDITSIQCFLDEEAAKDLTGGAGHVRMRSLGDKQSYLVPREAVIEAFHSGIDYLE